MTHAPMTPAQAPAAPVLEFWFDFASTYSYLSASRIAPLAAAAGVTLVWRPFLLGPLFEALGWNDSPFNVYPTKGRYMWRDLERLCAKYDLPLRRPGRFPRNGLLPARVVMVAPAASWVPDFVRDVFAANFADDQDIADPAVIQRLLDARGLDGVALIAAAGTPENKLRLRAQTEEATRRGLFGAPSFTVGDELFWGNDRLEDALAFARNASAG